MSKILVTTIKSLVLENQTKIHYAKNTIVSIERKAYNDGISAIFFPPGRSNAITIGVTEMEVN